MAINRALKLVDSQVSHCETPHFLGHRSRLKERFMISQNNIPDYEILEMVLFWSIPRKDVKDLAKTLLKEFGNISNIVHAAEDKLLSIEGVTNAVYTNFRLLKEILLRCMQSSILNKNIIASWDALVEYLRVTQGNIKTEQFRVLYLNLKNILIADELQEVGTVDQTAAYPREILKRALFHEAVAIILVHNHPSGNPEPSKADILLTKEIETGCKALSINLYDHVIVSTDNIYSFKSNCLL
jgi:DNA repair protein RadC